VPRFPEEVACPVSCLCHYVPSSGLAFIRCSCNQARQWRCNHGPCVTQTKGDTHKLLPLLLLRLTSMTRLEHFGLGSFA
jgi:hypothetical protein